MSPKTILETVSNECQATIVWLLVPLGVVDILLAIEQGTVTLADYHQPVAPMHIGAQPVPASLALLARVVFPTSSTTPTYGLESCGPGCVHLGGKTWTTWGAILAFPATSGAIVDEKGERSHPARLASLREGPGPHEC